MNIDELQLEYRPVTKADHRFIRDLYCSTRQREIDATDWPEKQKKIFLRQQFALQQKHYDKTYPQANKQLITYQGRAIGRFYTNKDLGHNRWHIIDITLAIEFRGMGIGSYILQHWIRQARDTSVIVSLYVDSLNPARHLYERLGFKIVKSEGRYFYMEKR